MARPEIPGQPLAKLGATPASGSRVPALVSVVIPVYNATDTLGAQLDALERQTYEGPFEVVLGDNGSTDGLRDWVAARATDRFKIVIADASDRRGVSHARNVAVREARGDLLLICDADDVVAPQWMHELIATAACADIVGGALDGVQLNTPAARAGRMVHDPRRLPVKMDFLPYAHGCNLAVWPDVIRAVGGWDNDMLGGEDAEFSWRAQLAGFRIAPAPGAVVHYRYRDSPIGLARQMFGYAVADVALYKRYRSDGARRRPAALLRRDLWLLLTRWPLLVDRDRRGRWINRAAQLSGRVVGSLKQHVWYI